MHSAPAKLLDALPGLAALALACLAPVHASVLEKLVMPGRVVESHAQFEDDCAVCHAPLKDVAQATLCLGCHEEIAEDVTNGRGFHGRDKSASNDDCVSCHTDHEGRDAKIVIFEKETFNHQLTDFLLAGAHLELSCRQCHAPEVAWSAAPESCVGCHENNDPHLGGLGPACGDCHSAANWIDTHFDHFTTGFPLLGAHQQTGCSGCHAEQDFTEVPDQCVDCHRSDDVHKGLNGPHCHDCHNPVEWGATAFDHRSLTGFALLGGHDGLTCQACHGSVKLTGLSGADCNACHQDDDVHQGNNGSDCSSCHQVRQWQTVSFDHAVTTGFLLRGAHSERACESCHTGPLEQALPSDCAGCHEADDVHRAQLGSACDSCHGETAWTSQVAFDHDLTSFPLLGQHGTLMCESCHASPAFHDVDDNCAACHGDDDSHGGRLGSNCAVCHNPSDWGVVSFDHNEQTQFSLTGAHITASCVSCHRNSGEQAAAASVCGQCHRRDDKHSGRFGQDCVRCHTTDSFREVTGL